MRARTRGAVSGRGDPLAECLARGRPLTVPAAWQLELGEPFEARNSELVVPAKLAGGAEVVVKVQLADDVESEREADALRFWDGRGAVRLLAQEPAERAPLLERCRPGTSLWAVAEEEAVSVGAAVLRRLWRPRTCGAEGAPVLAGGAGRLSPGLPGLECPARRDRGRVLSRGRVMMAA